MQPTKKKILGYDFVFKKQDHTLGNLLQTWIDQNVIDNGDVNFAGYVCPHPLRDEMVFTIGVIDGQESTARRILKETARSCAAMFRGWADSLQTDTAITAVAPAARRKRVIARPI